MYIPHCTDIRKLGEIGEGSHISVSLQDTLPHLDIEPNLAHELVGFSEKYANASLHVLSALTDAPREGRGTYFTEGGKTFYVKGNGSLPTTHPNDPLQVFTNKEGGIFHDRVQPEGVFPRVRGASYLEGANFEFFHCLRAMVGACQFFEIRSLKELTERGIPLPISVAVHPGLTRVLRERSRSELGDVRKWEESRVLASVTQMTPSSERISKSHFYADNLIPDDVESVARGIRSFYSSSSGLISSGGPHLQNFYRCGNALITSADFEDTIFLAELPESTRVTLLAGILFCLPQFGITERKDQVKTWFEALSGDNSVSFPPEKCDDNRGRVDRWYFDQALSAAQVIVESGSNDYIPSGPLTALVFGSQEAYAASHDCEIKKTVELGQSISEFTEVYYG